LFGESIVKRCTNTAGIDERAGMGCQGAGSGDPVTGDPWLIVDDSNFPTRKTIEESGFPDIGATDDGDSWHKFRFSNFNSQEELYEKLEVW
jgi:hypothetical protein